MMKTGKPALQGAKASGSSMDSNLAYPSSSLEVSPCPETSQVKSKLNRFKLITSILKQGSSTASPRPPEAFNGLPNGLLSVASDESSSEKSSQRRNFPKDINDFGLFQKHHCGRNEAMSSTEVSRKMYSLSEETTESGGSEAEGQDKDHATGGTDEKGLLETENKDKAAVHEAMNESSEVSNMNNSLDGSGQKDREDKDNESLPCSDTVAGGCLSGSSREELQAK